jgi:hypothetical protein
VKRHGLLAGQLPANNDVNPVAEEYTVLGAVTKQRLEKTQQSDKS